MRVIKWLCAAVCISAGLVTSAQGPASTTTGPVHLQVDDLQHPLGIDDVTPRFSWQLNDTARGSLQTAYRMLVATKPEMLRDGKADIWDSKKVSSAQSLNVKYAGSAVKPSTRYWWRVELGVRMQSHIPRARRSGGRQACWARSAWRRTG